MNKLSVILGIVLICLSFYSTGPVICNELNPGCVGTEHHYTILPYFLVMLGGGLFFLSIGLKSVSLMSFTKA